MNDSKLDLALLGFCSDLGVLRNNGRVGSFKGSNALRDYINKLPFDNNIKIQDFGNVICDSSTNNLEESQLELGNKVSNILNKGFLPVILGGGHETAYGHYLGIKQTKYAENIGIINFDAHFDLRPLLKNNKGSSGTPFRQIYLDRDKSNYSFDYLCIGIQESGNSKELFDFADYSGTEYIKAKEFHLNNYDYILSKLNKFLENNEYIYLSICLDVFSQSIAPGVSAPQPLGLMPQQIISLLELIKKSKKLITFDVVELNPKYDIDNMTAKLGANLVYLLVN